MSQNQQSQHQGDGELLGAMFFVAGYFILTLCWQTYHTQLSEAYIWLRAVESYLFWSVENILHLQMFAPLVKPTQFMCVPVHWWQISKCIRPPSTIQIQEIAITSLWWNGLFLLPIGYILIRGYLKVEKYHPSKRFGTIHTLETFIKEQEVNHPHLLVFGPLNLQKESNQTGPLRGNETTREFVTTRGLVHSFVDRQIDGKSVPNRSGEGSNEFELIPRIDIDRLETELIQQMGSPWSGIYGLTTAEIMLFALYLPRACSTLAETSDAEYYRIAEQCMSLETNYWVWVSKNRTKVGLDAYPTEPLKRIIYDYLQHPVFKDIATKHAYNRTMLIAIISKARTLGVMAPCQVRWLRLYDRTLWATVQNIGRPSLFLEGGGPTAHFQMEAAAKQGLIEPNFDVAIRGLIAQLSTYRYDPPMVEKMLTGVQISDPPLDLQKA